MKKNMNAWFQRALRPDALLFILCVATFLAWPQLDLVVASRFFEGGTFPLNQNPLVQFIYKLFAKIHFAYLFVLLGLILFAHLKKHLNLKKQSLYLLCCLLLGPGILVNVVLKDNSLGRPRPVHIHEFGGSQEFTQVFYYSGACKKNCSFVSGHAAIGYYFMALAWAFRRRYWLDIGIASGLAIGFVRIVQGGHFLSDVIFSGWVIYGTCTLLGAAFSYKPRK